MENWNWMSSLLYLPKRHKLALDDMNAGEKCNHNNDFFEMETEFVWNVINLKTMAGEIVCHYWIVVSSEFHFLSQYILMASSSRWRCRKFEFLFKVETFHWSRRKLFLHMKEFFCRGWKKTLFLKSTSVLTFEEEGK